MEGKLPNNFSEILLMTDHNFSNIKRARIHQKLFGFKTKKRTKTYYFNGFLCRWDKGKRIAVVHHTPLGHSSLVIPKMHAHYLDGILQIYKKLGIAVRVCYLVQNDYYDFDA